MKIWNLNTDEEDFTWTPEQIEAWLYRTDAECLARHGDISYWRIWESAFFSEIWRIEP